MQATEAKWANRVEAWRASGKTAEAFAAGQEFAPTTLRFWASKLKTARRAEPTVPMARVLRRRRPGTGEGPSAEIEIAVGNARIVVRRGFDAELLRAVALALGAAK